MRLRSRELFETARTEGGLLPADLLQRVADDDRTLPGLAPGDYHLDPAERLTERITRSWARLTSAWSAFDRARQQLPPGDHAGALTRESWLQILFDELGYGRLVQQPAIQIEDKSYPIFTQWMNSPIHLVGAGISLDQRHAGVRGAASQSPHGLVQELLNRSPERLWGFVSNGLLLRVLRDNVTLTRQAYVQFDLEAMLTGEVYSDFVLLWLVCHESRVEAAQSAECWLERWSHEAADTGTRALEALREGVHEAITTLGAGFLSHPANRHLHEQLMDGNLEPAAYYRTLLRLVYRLLFLFVAEDRDALLDPDASDRAQRRYHDHYSTAHLRELAAKRRGGRHRDRYEQLKLVMAALHQDGSSQLALPALGSYLWEPSAIGPLATAQIANEHLFSAVRSLATVQQDDVRRSVDFRNLGAEELGSVYESLLELHPTINRDSHEFTLDTVAGSERKTTGSYYTPTSLISSLLDTALEPVLDEAARAENPEQAILALAVVDPACGSGHFLIAAANRIAKRLAAIRSDDPEPSPTRVREALRDVVGHCIHGVDVNPMAVELCKVSLWMEALEPGRPLSFLDHRIVLGNSLLGTIPALIADGIPNDAFKPILGDDKKFVPALRKRNEKERSGQLTFDLGGDRVDADVHAIATQAAALDAVNDRSLSGIREQQRRFQALLRSPELQRAQLAADTWCAAFVAPKREDVTPVTEGTLSRTLSSGESGLSAAELAAISEAKATYSFLHWHVAFPDVWERGGFDVVLGNPPWERVKLQEKEFFAALSPEIANAPNKAARDRLIKGLATENPELLQAFDAAKRQAEGASHLIRDSGRYPLCGRGDVNTYAVFAELMRNAINPSGRAGVIVPTGIATDDTTKLFFQSLVERRSLASLYDFENRAIFPSVHSSYKFSLLTLAGRDRPVDAAAFVFFAHRVEDLEDIDKRFTLTAEDIALLNPNTRTCPVFRTRRDADLARAIHRRVPLLNGLDHEPGRWKIKYRRMFHMSDDSRAFVTATDAQPGQVRLYEAKMFHHFDHRWATYDGATDRQVTLGEKSSPTALALPRYWLDAPCVAAKTPEAAQLGWLVSWRDICRSTDERTCIVSAVPAVATSNTCPMILPAGASPVDLARLLAVVSSFPFDWLVRQKIGGTHLSYAQIAQIACPPPDAVAVSSFNVTSRVLELTYTAVDLEGFASDLGYDGPPFRWDPGRRGLIRAELDALMFRLYAIERNDVDYIMDTFPIVKRRDHDRFGGYRTKDLILERYDAMVAADAAGVRYETPLDPQPGDPRAAHPTHSVLVTK